MQEQFDLLVIGAGPGGYVAAIKAAGLGMKTALIENREAGGTCLHRGCIPAKAMIHAASLYRSMMEGEAFGIIAEKVTFDYGKILSYKTGTSETLCKGIEQLLKANKITYIKGTGRLKKDGLVSVRHEIRNNDVTDQTDQAEQKERTEQIYQAEKILLATGSKPFLPPIDGIGLPGVLTSDGLFSLDRVPESLLIIGGGVIGVEFASVFSTFGTRVMIIEAMPRLLPNMDKEISRNLKMLLKKRGVDIHTGSFVEKIRKEESGLICSYKEKESEQEIKAEYILVAAGRIPNTDGLFEDGLSIKTEGRKIAVDADFQTSLPGVYAVGDVTGGMQLAHLASAQGICAVEKMNGGLPSVNIGIVPSCVYTEPEIASVGITEEEAKEKDLTVMTGKFVMNANGKSLLTKEERGFIKVIIDEESHVLLGAQMMCARATDMIGEMVTAMANRLTAEELLKGMRAHPTYNEGIGEALEDCLGGAIHSMPRR